MKNLQSTIETAYADRDGIINGNPPKNVRAAVLETIELLDSGQLRIAEKKKWAMAYQPVGKKSGATVFQNRRI